MSDDSGVHVIRVHLSSISQLFNSLDPSPFVGRDLDVNAESFIMEWAEEHPARGAFRLEILLNQCDDLAAARDRVVQAVHAYFLEREQLARRDFRRLMGEGRPLEIFLYDWWPLLRRIRLLRRLSVMEVHLQRNAGAPSEKR